VPKLTMPSAIRLVSGMVFRTRVIVRLGTQNRMVTKGYRKGVYDRVTLDSVGAGVPSRVALPTRVTSFSALFLEGPRTSRDK
jgi:hypothetical protein